MATVKILTLGKVRERWLELAIAEYSKRLQGRLNVDIILAKNDEQLTLLASREKRCLALDPTGELLSSEAFADRLFAERPTFIIGGPLGLPEALRRYPLISLSPMIFTHQMARLILLEQLYRASEIQRGSQYHKNSVAR